MNKKVRTGIILFIVVVISLLVIIPEIVMDPEEEKAAPSGERRLPVDGIIVRYDSLDDYIVTSGSMMANESVGLTAERSGKIMKINFEEGDKVSRGQVLVSLDNSELAARRKRLGYSIKLREKQIKRQEELLEVGGISQEEYDITLAELNSFKAEIEEIEALINNSIIKAPFEGVIGLRSVSEGSYITPAEPIAQLIDDDPLKIEFSLPEIYAGRIKPGNEVFFNNQSLQQEGKAEIYAIEPRIEQSTRTIQVRAKTDNKEGIYIPGMFVNLRLVLSTTGTALMVPSQALIPQQNGFMVYIKQNGKAFLQDVKIGRRTPDQVQIVDGLSPGDTVLTTGMLQLNEGMKVEVINLKTPAK